MIDDGATQALLNRGTSLLAVGVLSLSGQFEQGDVVEVLSESGELVARGASAIASHELVTVKGRGASQGPSDSSPLVVHRDELVLLMGDF